MCIRDRPSDTSLLQIEDGQDLVTLVTCTPVGVNTHRLLVRGHRVAYVAELVVEKDVYKRQGYTSMEEVMNGSQSSRMEMGGMM